MIKLQFTVFNLKMNLETMVLEKTAYNNVDHYSKIMHLCLKYLSTYLRKQLFTTDNFCPSILCSHGFITLNINHWNIINTQLNTYTMLNILKSSVSYEAGVSIKGCMQYMFTTSHTSANTRTFFVTPNGFGNIRVPRNEGISYKNRLTH